jgi:STE24 endopeptidase
MNRRRVLILAVVLGAMLLAPGALAARASTQAEVPRRANLHDFFSNDDFQRARRFRTPRYALGFIGLGAEVIALLAIGLAAGTRRLGALATRLGGERWWLQAIVLVAALSIVLALVDLPFSIGRQNLDKAWGLSTQTLPAFMSDVLRGLVFQIVVGVVAALALLGVARALPRGWPFAVAGVAVALTVALSMLWPLIYEPLFNKFTPVEPALRDRIVAIGAKEGVRVGSVVVADASKRTTTKNAYVSGLGATKRVVLYDTLLRLTPAEVDLVVAHELGHVAHNDVAKGTALGALGAAAAVALIWFLLSRQAVRSYLGVTGPGDPRVLPFVVLVITLAGLLALPLQNWYSRRIEAAADRAAIATTHDPATQIRVEISLARDSIADLQPNAFIRWAFFTHPPTGERIQLALDYAATHPDTQPSVGRLTEQLP